MLHAGKSSLPIGQGERGVAGSLAGSVTLPKITIFHIRFQLPRFFPTFVIHFIGNGRTARLLMNLLEMEYGLLPVKVLKEDRAEYIQALVDSRENEDAGIFLDCLTRLHIRHLQREIDQYLLSTGEKMVDKEDLKSEILLKWSIKPSLAVKLVDVLLYMADKETTTTEALVLHFGFTPTTAKRYLRQLCEFGYLKAQGGNRNRTYRKIGISNQ